MSEHHAFPAPFIAADEAHSCRNTVIQAIKDRALEARYNYHSSPKKQSLATIVMHCTHDRCHHSILVSRTARGPWTISITHKDHNHGPMQVIRGLRDIPSHVMALVLETPVWNAQLVWSLVEQHTGLKLSTYVSDNLSAKYKRQRERRQGSVQNDTATSALGDAEVTAPLESPSETGSESESDHDDSTSYVATRPAKRICTRPAARSHRPNTRSQLASAGPSNPAPTQISSSDNVGVPSISSFASPGNVGKAEQDSAVFAPLDAASKDDSPSVSASLSLALVTPSQSLALVTPSQSLAPVTDVLPTSPPDPTESDQHKSVPHAQSLLPPADNSLEQLQAYYLRLDTERDRVKQLMDLTAEEDQLEKEREETEWERERIDAKLLDFDVRLDEVRAKKKALKRRE